jgi:hypothetical protein
MSSTVAPTVSSAPLPSWKVDGFDLDAVLDRALAAVGMKRETFAGLLGVSGPRLSQMVQSGRLCLVSLSRAAQDADGRTVVASVVREWAEAMGIEDVDAVAARLADVLVMERKRMARASLRDSQATRRSA